MIKTTSSIVCPSRTIAAMDCKLALPFSEGSGNPVDRGFGGASLYQNVGTSWVSTDRGAGILFDGSSASQGLVYEDADFFTPTQGIRQYAIGARFKLVNMSKPTALFANWVHESSGWLLYIDPSGAWALYMCYPTSNDGSAIGGGGGEFEVGKWYDMLCVIDSANGTVPRVTCLIYRDGKFWRVSNKAAWGGWPAASVNRFWIGNQPGGGTSFNSQFILSDFRIWSGPSFPSSTFDAPLDFVGGII